MKILNTSQIREADSYTIKHEPVTSVDLMERASSAFCHWFIRKFETEMPVIIFCGMGNNGGDGLAIARMLLQKQYEVKVYVIKTKETGSNDFEENLRRLSKISEINFIREAKDIPNVPDNTVVIDALFGSGLSKTVKGLFAEVIAVINNSEALKVSVDIASGLFSDQYTESDAIVRPQFTVSFQMPKLAFLMPENESFTGRLVVVDIGLSKDFLSEVETPYTLLQEEMIAGMLKRREKFAHKGEFGRVILVSGSWGKIGATVLCAKACLRTGAGLLFIHAPGCAYNILQTTVPEAMVETDDKKKKITKVRNDGNYDVIGVGPGIGTAASTHTMLAVLLKGTKNPMVIDADALNILASHQKLLKYIPKNSLLTPHPKEFERLAGKFNNSFERLALQKKFSKQNHCITIVKGAHTTICTPSGEVYFNSTGNPGMATGGSGDVLTGMLAALIGQRYTPLKAALIGVYLHGLAGDLAAKDLGEEAMLPTDLIERISAAYKVIRT